VGKKKWGEPKKERKGKAFADHKAQGFVTPGKKGQKREVAGGAKGEAA